MKEWSSNRITAKIFTRSQCASIIISKHSFITIILHNIKNKKTRESLLSLSYEKAPIVWYIHCPSEILSIGTILFFHSPFFYFPIIIEIISLSVSFIPLLANLPTFLIVLSTPFKTIPSPSLNSLSSWYIS